MFGFGCVERDKEESGSAKRSSHRYADKSQSHLGQPMFICGSSCYAHALSIIAPDSR